MGLIFASYNPKHLPKFNLIGTLDIRSSELLIFNTEVVVHKVNKRRDELHPYLIPFSKK